MPRVIIWQVTGMTCASCERLIGNVLQEIPGAMDVQVSVKRSTATLRLPDGIADPSLDELNAKLREHGYMLAPSGCALPTRSAPIGKRLVRAIIAVLIAGLALLAASPLRTLVPSVSAGASVGALTLLGLVASVSTCLASTGGFLLAYSAEAHSKRKTILMHVGRLTTFVVGGAILGAVGGALPQGSTAWYGAIALLLGIGFFFVALNLLDLSPSLAKFGISLPSSLHRFADRIKRRPGNVTPFLVGAVTFILPCGFTQTAQALALASSSATRGALLLGAFALGTLPVLLGVTTFASAATLRHRTLRLAIGAVLFFFAISQVQSGLSVFGVSTEFGASNVSAAKQSDIQVVDMNVTPSGYVPSRFTLKKGIPVRWEINAQDGIGCANTIVSHDLGVSQNLQTGMNIIQFTPQHTGTVAFSCSMGMVRGSFSVID